MSDLVADCPRCGAKQITFDLREHIIVGKLYDWQHRVEAFCICRRCLRATIFHLKQRSSESKRLFTEKNDLAAMSYAVNHVAEVEGFVSLKDTASIAPPDHLPTDVDSAFKEAATCLATGCYNAAGAMFRLCLDMATRSRLPEGEVEGLNHKTRRDLGLRLPWLFDNDRLPGDLRGLSSCVREDGNDGAHAGSLKKEDVEDLLDFSTALLERIYTEPERLRLAEQRRQIRRTSPTPPVVPKVP